MIRHNVTRQLLQVLHSVFEGSAVRFLMPATACSSLEAAAHLEAAASTAVQHSTSTTPTNLQFVHHRRSYINPVDQLRAYSSQSDAAGAEQQKRHAMKCNTAAAGSPVSQAIACMVDRDVMPRQQLCNKMDQLSQQLSQDAASFSSTELSAFAEACRKMEYQHSHAFKAIMQQLAAQAADIAADELPSLIWAASTLADTTSSSSSSSSSSSVTSSSSSKVPQNDGVVGSVNSSRIAGLPQVLDFMLGASQVLSGDMDALDSQELPILAAALAALEYRDPFLLTVLAETVLERKGELSESELVALLQSFAAMGRWFFDNRVLDQLTAVLVERAQAGKAGQQSVAAVAECLAGINHKNKMLQAYVQETQHS